MTFRRPRKEAGFIVLWSLPPYKKQGNHRKSYMVIYENSKIIESTIEIYGKMLVITDHTAV